MPIDFPSSVSAGYIHTEGNFSYQFTASNKWKPVNRVDYTVQSSNTAIVSSNAVIIDMSKDGIQSVDLTTRAVVSFTNVPGLNEYEKVLIQLTANIDQSYTFVEQLNTSDYIYDNITGNVETGSGGTTHIRWGKDGYRLYGMDFENDTKGFHQYNLTIPYDLSTIAYSSSKFLASSQVYARGSDIKTDGSIFYVLVDNQINSYPAVTNWEISNWGSATSNSVPGGRDARRIRFGNNANKLYLLVNGATSYLQEYILPSPWSLTGFSSSSVSNFTATLSFSATDFFISSTGDKIWIVDATTDSIKEYSMTNWNLSTIQYTGYQLSTAATTTDPFSIELANNKMYLCTGDATATSVIYRYSTAKISTLSSLQWPSAIEWESGYAPSLPSPQQTALIEIEARTDYIGTNYVGRLVGRNF